MFLKSNLEQKYVETNDFILLSVNRDVWKLE